MPPLTGIVGIYGPEIVWAAKIACDEVNEGGGLLGRRLELMIEDDGSLPATAVPAALKLVKRGCVALVGNLLSNSRIAVAAQVAEPKKIPYLNFSFYEGSIQSRYFFHFAALPNQQIDKMIPYMANRYGYKMFFAGNNYEWPRGSIDAAKRALKRIDGDVVGEEYLSIGADIFVIHRLLDQVACSGADVFVPYFAGEDQIALLTHFAGRGLKRRMAVVMGHFDEVMARRLGPSVREGLYSVNSYYMTINSDENRHYLDRLRRLPGVRGVWPNGNGVMSNFGEGTYVCVHAFAEAVRRARGVEVEGLVEGLEGVEVVGPQGRVVMDAETHHASVNTYLARCRGDGTFPIVERFGCNRPKIPERYRVPLAHARGLSAGVSQVRVQPEGEVIGQLEAAQTILSHVDAAILVTDGVGTIQDVNTNTCEMFGYTREELLGMSVHMLLPPHFRQHHAQQVLDFTKSTDTKKSMAQRSDVSGYRQNGTFFPAEVSLSKFRTGEDWSVVATIRDITERKLLEESLRQRALYDELTQIPNRDLIRVRCVKALRRSAQHNEHVALLLVGIDHFKTINDTYGHALGDALLQTLPRRLLEHARPGDTIARHSGDTFVLLCERIQDPQAVQALAQRLTEAACEPFHITSIALSLTVSIGLAIGHGSTHTVDDLLRFADTAMYEVKRQKRGGWQLFNDHLQENIDKRLTIAHGLRHARTLHELSYRFQPIFCLAQNAIIGAELLLRWHPPSGNVPPAFFVPIADMTGEIIPIGADTFREACRVQVAWSQLWPHTAPSISINLSPRQLAHPDLRDDLAYILRDTLADPSKLILDISEAALMTHTDAHTRTLHALADLGLQIAIDDFGTSSSSLPLLARLPIHILKIDRTLILSLHDNKKTQAIIQSLVTLSHTLSLRVCAEGVETPEQYKMLQQYQCDLAQGYHLSHPLRENQFIDFFNQY